MKLHYKAPQRQLSQGCTILLTQIVLFERIMHDYAEICNLCNQMRFLVNYAGLHHCTLSEALRSIIYIHMSNTSLCRLSYITCRLSVRPLYIFSKLKELEHKLCVESAVFEDRI